MDSLREKVTSGLELIDSSTLNVRQTLDSLQDNANSLVLLTVQWKEMESYFDSMKNILQKRAKELEAKEKEIYSKLSDLEKKEEVEVEKLRSEFEPLVSLLAKNMGSSVTMVTKSSSLPDFADDLVKKNSNLARMVPYLDPAKFVLDAVEASFKEYLDKDLGEADDSVANSCILLLDTLIKMNLNITVKVKQEATQLGIDWISKAKTNPNHHSLVLGCLLFQAAYGLASVTTHEVLFNLLEPFLLNDHAPKLFRSLGLKNKVHDVVETLKQKEEYLGTLKYICEFKLYKLCPRGRPGDFLLEILDASEKAAQVNAGTGDSVEEQKARKEKRKADAVMALKYINETKSEYMFPSKVLKKLIELKDDESASAAMNHEERQRSTKTKSIIPHEEESEAKRQRLTEPETSLQSSIVNHQLGDKSVPSQPYAIATHPSSSQTKSNIFSGSITADMLRELLKKTSLGESEDLFNALKCTQDPAKLVLDTSMALFPSNPKGSYEFKLLITSANCFLLLNQMKKLMPQIGDTVKHDAKKLAVYWKDKFPMSKQCNLEVICFLEFLGIFGIVSEFKANDLLGLLNNSYWRTVSPNLFQFLALEYAIPDFIHNLIKTGHRLKAVNYIYSLDMVNKFRPVSDIIKDSLRITKQFAEKSFREAKDEYSAQVAAIDRQINSLRNAIKCIKSHKLESEFESENLEERINSLLKIRGNLSDGSGIKTDLTIQQSKTAKPTNVAEVGSVTKNSPLELSTAAASSSASKPSRKMNKKKRKRSLSGSIQSSGHVASLTSNYSPVASLTSNYIHVASLTSNHYPVVSLTSNHFPRHVYSLNQRQGCPINNGLEAFTVNLNPNHNYNQLRQPQLRPFYQHLKPFFRNH
ncbi:FRIGIDA-like protein 5 [Cardamine amara subsp. amara]|uniref:FRIGIDA-like protein n=1 Tax=Cardamine amara subsp. amara TaxID=228776 RepID=A0ABD1BUH8_CARAN